MDVTRARPFAQRLAPLVAVLVAVLVATTGCITIDVLGGGEEAELVETVVRGREGRKILLLDIDGVIGEADLSGALFGGPELGTVARVVEMLDRARQDDEIAAVLLRIDSPGGTATASEQVYEEIVRFKTERRIPVLAQLMGTATSGGYYVAMAADTIQAHPTTVTGSIGVIFTSLSVAGLMEKLGVEDQTLTGGEFKDAGSPFRRLSAVERAQLQTIVDDLHHRFREVVGRGRPKLSSEQIEALASGQVFSARQALEKGLVDRVGSLEEMVREVERRLGATRSRVVAYHRPREIRRNLYTRSSAVDGLRGALGPSDRAIALQGIEQLVGRSGFYYLWGPGRLWGPARLWAPGSLSAPGTAWSPGLVQGLAAPVLGGSTPLGPMLQSDSPELVRSDAKSRPSDIPFTNIAD